MSAREPWHKHKFRPGVQTPNSCEICSAGKNAPQHKGKPRSARRNIGMVLKREPWKIW